MTKQHLLENTEGPVEIEIRPARKTSTLLQLLAARIRRRPVRILFPPRFRESCLTRRAMLAALREAEFDDWQASGGDYLDSMHQSVS